MVQDIVQEVLAKMQIASDVSGNRGVFADMNEAIAAAQKAQKVVARMTLDHREKVISNIRKKINENAEILARMGVEETGMGNVGHKILKHQLVAEKTPGTEDITTTAWSGDRGLTLIEMGPFGVIGAITPCTNPSETVLCNTIGMFAGGNTVVFNPHPAAIKTSIYAVNLLNEASVEAGGPDNIACTVEHPTLETSNIMMKHKAIQLIAATGGPGVVTAVLSSGRRGIGAGAGNPPALVDETADIRKAAEDIVNGCTFDNNLPCIAEKEIVAVESVADELLHYMIQEQGCYLASKEEQDALTAVVLKDGRLNRKCVGRDAKTLLGMIGVTVPDNIRCITFEGPKEHCLLYTSDPSGSCPLCLCPCFFAKIEILCDVAGEKDIFLGYIADQRTQIVDFILFCIDAVDQHFAEHRVIQAWDKFQDTGFSSSGTADDRRYLSGTGYKAYIL